MSRSIDRLTINDSSRHLDLRGSIRALPSLPPRRDTVLYRETSIIRDNRG